VVPLLDHILSEMEARFQSVSASAGVLCALLPSVLSTGEGADLSSIQETYGDDMPSPELLDMEMARWKRRYEALDEPPDSFASALGDCKRDSFPNIHVLLRIACTLPATSCECERCCSTLRRLSNYMHQERLSALALIHIHYEKKINLMDVVDRFAKLHQRRLQLSNVLFDE